MSGTPRPTTAAPGLLIPGPWAADALCAQTDPDLWYPELGGHAQAALARRICHACPVRAECLDYALAGADTWKGLTTGIWGGTTGIAAARPRRGRITASRDEWLTVDEVCDELNIGRRTFERWRTLGIAPRATRPTRNGPLRIKRSWLEEWAEDGAT